MSEQKVFLNIGCGQSHISKTNPYFKDWKEVRADLYRDDVDLKCDLVDMSQIADKTFDCVWASHVVEHQYWHEMPKVFENLMRIIKDDGFVIVKVPDVGAIADRIKDGLLEPIPQLYGLAPIDFLYGMRMRVENDPLGEIHKTCFTMKSMEMILGSFGIKAFLSDYNYEITAVLYKEKVPESYLNYNRK